jgi:hypothetical protein
MEDIMDNKEVYLFDSYEDIRLDIKKEIGKFFENRIDLITRMVLLKDIFAAIIIISVCIIAFGILIAVYMENMNALFILIILNIAILIIGIITRLVICEYSKAMMKSPNRTLIINKTLYYKYLSSSYISADRIEAIIYEELDNYSELVINELNK